MGRKHYTERIPQHSRHAKEQQSWLYNDDRKPVAFGIRRIVPGLIAMNIGVELRRLQAEGELSEAVTIEQRPALSVVSMEFLGKQMTRGQLKQSPEMIKQKLQTRCRREKDNEVEAEITGVSIRGGHNVNLTVASPRIVREQTQIAEILGYCGVKGLGRYLKWLDELTTREKQFPVTVARLDRLIPLTEREQVVSTVEAVVDTVHRFEEPLPLEAWDIYPDFERLAA